MANILIVEDDMSIANLLLDHLERAGHQPRMVSDGDEALTSFSEDGADLIILDIMLPGRSGFSLCESVRKSSSPQPLILMLTARVAEADLLLGFELGADDYIRKPFGLRELLVRIEALLRLVHRASQERLDEEPIRLGSILLDPRKRKVEVNGEPVSMTPMEFDLLCYLARRPGQVIDREQLLSDVWGYDHSGYLRTVDTHINRLRRKLEPHHISPRLFRTVHGVGYALEPDLMSHDRSSKG